MSLPGQHWGHPMSKFSWNLTTDAKKVKNVGERLKKGRQKFCERNTKYFRGHPRTSLAPGIQQPLHATESCSSITSLDQASLALKVSPWSEWWRLIIIGRLSERDKGMQFLEGWTPLSCRLIKRLTGGWGDGLSSSSYSRAVRTHF